MNQKNGKESIQDFVARSQNDSLKKIHDYMTYVRRASQSSSDSGLHISDLGSKISVEEGKLEILSHVSFLIDDNRT